MPAEELYTSTLFRLARAYAGAFNAWAILSARYGLVFPRRVIEPYDQTLSRMRVDQCHEWAGRTHGQLVAEWGKDITFVVLAGARYADALNGLRHRQPMRGMSIGMRLRWLKIAAGLGHVDAAACCAHSATGHAAGGECCVPGCACLALVVELGRPHRADRVGEVVAAMVTRRGNGKAVAP